MVSRGGKRRKALYRIGETTSCPYLKKESIKKRDGQMGGKGEDLTPKERKLTNKGKAEDHRWVETENQNQRSWTRSMTPTGITSEREQRATIEALNKYPWTMEDVRRHDAEGKGMGSWNTNPEHVSSSFAPRQESSSSAPPAETNKNLHTCEHGVKTLKPRKSRKRKNLREIEERRLEKRRQKVWSLNSKWEKR